MSDRPDPRDVAESAESARLSERVGRQIRRRARALEKAARAVRHAAGDEAVHDLRVAATTAKFAQIEIKRGIFPVGGATLRFPRECGWGNAMRWLLTGDEFGADEALRLGLVQEVVPPGPWRATSLMRRSLLPVSRWRLSPSIGAPMQAISRWQPQ